MAAPVPDDVAALKRALAAAELRADQAEAGAVRAEEKATRAEEKAALAVAEVDAGRFDLRIRPLEFSLDAFLADPIGYPKTLQEALA